MGSFNFDYKNFNPFLEGGPAGFRFTPHSMMPVPPRWISSHRPEVGAVYGGGIAYEISPSFDIRAEYRGLVTKTPNFGYSSVLKSAAGTTSPIQSSASLTTSKIRSRLPLKFPSRLRLSFVIRPLGRISHRV